MPRSATLPISAVVIALAVFAGPAAAADVHAPDSMIATVQQVNAQDSTVTVVYGVSLALKAADLTVAPHCHVSLKGSHATLGDIRRGQVVRIQYRTGDDGALIAEAIEVLRSPEDEP